MFNLLVHWDEDAWDLPLEHDFERARCVREYTDPAIVAQYGSLDVASIAALTQMPAIFAYEKPSTKQPRLGRITLIEPRVNSQSVYFEYELFNVPCFSSDELWSLSASMDLGRLESTRTHWAVKGVDLGRLLTRYGYALPVQVVSPNAPEALPRVPVNIHTHEFQVALSFPGPYRETVERVARRVTALLGQDSCFYDFDYQAQLARPGIDVVLQQLYTTRARLIVVFLGSEYQERPWPSIEWNAIRGIINAKEHDRIMFIRMDDGVVDGVQRHDGYIDARIFDAETIGAFIAQRVSLLPPPPEAQA